MEQNAANSTKTVVGKPFLPGVSGYPGGRLKGLASYIRESTAGGAETVDLMVAVMRGETINGMKPKIKNMTDGAGWLADRGFGRAIAQIEARSLNVDLSLAEMNTKELLALLQASRD